MRALIAWFTQLGWAANAITIAGAVAAGYWAFHRRIALFLGPRSFAALVSKHQLGPWNREHVKSLVKVAIVDDNLADFPIAELRSDGFSIKSYRQVRLSDVASLRAYDLIFLDMHGIVADDVELGGLKLISRLRQENFRQKICAVSSKTFDPTATTFFKQADEVKKKPMTAQQCRDVIVELTVEAFDPSNIARQLDQYASNLSFFARRQLLRDVDRLIVGALPPEELSSHLPPSSASPNISSATTDFIRVMRHARQ